MKSIHATFQSIDEAEIAVGTLKNEFKFSYSFKQVPSAQINQKQDFNFLTPSSGNNGTFYSIVNFNPYPDDSSIVQLQPYFEDNVILRVKCENESTDALIDRLYNLGGRDIKII